MKKLSFLLLFMSTMVVYAQNGYWQQFAEYQMEIDFNEQEGTFTGKQSIKYHNNSPDTLYNVYYHLYYNAFQPGSMMDVRSRTLPDPPRRIGSEIANLSIEEQGYHLIESLLQDGSKTQFVVNGTILEVDLNHPILPGTTAQFNMKFSSKVPKMVRRTGKDNAEGISYSMSQWYPKLCEYDKHGWHANPYIGREFHGVWGNFDITINMDADYTIGATGILQNPEEIGHGYADLESEISKERLQWHFKAENVHDFVWAADPDYVHKKINGPDDLTIHIFHEENEFLAEKFDSLAYYLPKVFEIMNECCGKYPYMSYSVIQGGDGGMEYPMATLINAYREFQGLLFVTVHEMVHSWFYGIVATNESKFGWMDEGFTTYFGDVVVVNVLNQSEEKIASYAMDAYVGNYDVAEPLNTHSDFYKTSKGYNISAYFKASVTLLQLKNIVGDNVFENAIKKYFEKWKFKHPEPDDFKIILEQESGMNLDWFFEQWVNTSNTIDYGIKSVFESNGKTMVTLEKEGEIPMPIEVTISYKNGTSEIYYIPLRIMRGIKDFKDNKVYLLDDWPWVYPEYFFSIKSSLEAIEKIEIDANKKMADINRKNNVFPGEKITFVNSKLEKMN